MSNKSFQNCEYAEEIVSFLYDEADSTEKSFFKAHLLNCSDCSEELANFTDVRSLITDWRETDFSPLELPKIDIPHDQAQISGTTSYNHASFIQRLKNIFAFPYFKPILAAATLLMAVIFVFIVIEKSRQPANLTAQADSTFNKINNGGNISPEIASNSLGFDKNADHNKIETKFENKSLQAENTALKPLNVPAKNTIVVPKIEVAVYKPIPLKSVKNSVFRHSLDQTVAVNHSKAKKLPELNRDDDEMDDNSLRLAELFDDNGGK